MGGNVTMILVPRNPNKTSLGPVIHTLKNTDFEIKDVRSKLAAAELIAEESAPKPMTRKGGRTGHGVLSPILRFLRFFRIIIR